MSGDNQDIGNNLSDDDFLALDETAFEVPVEGSTDEEDEPEEESEVDSEEEGSTEPEPEEDAEVDATDTEDTDTGSESSEEDADESSEEDEANASEEEDKGSEDVTAFQKAITAPFKADGVMHEISDPEDVVRLMKMGINYSGKMAKIKPQLKVIKMLERNNLLDETKLNYLIDLDKKDPNAISKLVKESGIETHDLDLEDNEYSPKNYSISDEEMQLEDVIADVKESASGGRTMQIIGNEWDNNSKQMLASNPQMIQIINEQVINGQYDQIAAVVVKERALGKLDNLSDIQAYDTVGKALAQQGVLVGTQQAPSEIVKPKTTKSKTDNSSRKKAASISSQRPTPKKSNDPLKGKDDDFLKEFNSLTL